MGVFRIRYCILMMDLGLINAAYHFVHDVVIKYSVTYLSSRCSFGVSWICQVERRHEEYNRASLLQQNPLML